MDEEFEYEEILPADYQLEREKDRGTNVSDRIQALERIKQMWEDFDLDEYMNSYNVAKVKDKNDSVPAAEVEIPTDHPQWRHRVTVPKPFDMTIRDEILSRRKEDKIERLRKEKLLQQRATDAELQAKRQFRANPVPAHVYLPIYDELSRTQEQRRQFVVEHSQQLLRSLQRPFKFSLRNNASRSLQRCSSAADIDRQQQEVEDAKRNFIARPVPSSTHDATIMEKMREKELYRKIEARMRAIETFQNASLPPSMEARKAAQREFFADTLRKRASSADRGKCRSDPAAFQRLTKPKTLPPRSRFIPPDPQDRSEVRNQRPRSAVTSRILRKDSAPPTKMTTTSELRMATMHRKLAEEKLKTEQEERLRNRHDQYHRDMVRHVRERSLGLSEREPSYDKKKELAEAMARRDREYRQELAEMEEKLASRPLLAERATAKIAKEQAARKYREALERAGLTEEEILHSTEIVDPGDYGTSEIRRSHHYAEPQYDDDFQHSFRNGLQESPIIPRSPHDDYAY